MLILTILKLFLIAIVNATTTTGTTTGTGVSRPIHIGLSVDEHSFRDSLFLINSIVETSYSPRDLFFHIVAVNKDEITSHRLKTTIEEHIVTCFPYFQYENSNLEKPNSSGHSQKGSPSASSSLSSTFKSIKSNEFTATTPLEAYFTRPGGFLDHHSSSSSSSSSGNKKEGPRGDRIRYEIVPFHLPVNSGFESQLLHFKRRIHHWNSASGADMVRFYLPSLFPNTEKILYLDNDLIISCCLEEIYDSYLPHGKAIGIILDDLKWAVITQFERHYNASHPLVIKHMTRHSRLNPTTTQDEKITEMTSVPKDYFMKLVPRYPNDGVILFNTTAYREMRILEDMDAIALANGQGEYVVNMGTQQFTVLTMYDRWEELSPRGNLRHFPDMARGYLMWFYYNGFIHYAGQSKPRLLCSMETFKENNWLRVQSYTAWLNNHYLLAKQCLATTSPGGGYEKIQRLFYTHCIANNHNEVPADQPQDQAALETAATAALKALETNTFNHVVHAKTVLQLYHFVEEITRTSMDMENIYVKIVDDSILSKGTSSASSSSIIDQIVKIDSLSPLEKAISLYRSNGLKSSAACPPPQGITPVYQNVLQTLDSIILYKTLWAIRLYHNPPLVVSGGEREKEREKAVDALKDALQEASLSYHKQHPLTPPPPPPQEKKKGRKGPPPPPKINLDPVRRNVRTFHGSVCRLKGDFYLPLPSSHPRTYVRNDSDFAPLYDRYPCVGILPHIKAEDKKHWDALVITISMSTVSASLHTLFSLDTVFMRPKIILLHLQELNTGGGIEEGRSGGGGEVEGVTERIVDGVNQAMKYLRRIGFLSSFQYTGVTPTDEENCVVTDTEHQHATKKLKIGNVGVKEAYVWGLRANKLEFQ